MGKAPHYTTRPSGTCYSLYEGRTMRVETRVFKIYDREYKNLIELAQAMGISVSQLYRVREGTRCINHKFIIGAKKAFPEYNLGDLFYLAPQPSYMSGAKVGSFGTGVYSEHSAFLKAQDTGERV